MKTRNVEIEQVVSQFKEAHQRSKHVFNKLEIAQGDLGFAAYGLVKQFGRPTLPMLKGVLKVVDGALDIYEGYTVLMINVAKALYGAAQVLEEQQNVDGALTEDELQILVFGKELGPVANTN